MDQERRDLIFYIADGQEDAFKILYQFDRLVHAKHFYRLLKKERIIGKKLVEMYRHKFEFSFLGFAKWCLRKMGKSEKIYYGRDYI
jgi:hypothetical protein